ncbi:MAG: RNHCP domain-containing protein [Candidatus Gracilibacteria bacterium]|nr:RNHCP domain-containing protein [Candidatus Gracilibacteria bacterium]
MTFVMYNENFECGYCHKTVTVHPEGSARNHCPYCLCSKHVDDANPGDRASECHGQMRPTDIDYRKNKGYMIRHQCMECKKTILNKVAPDDHFLEFIRKLNKERI